MALNFPIKKQAPKKLINKANLGMDFEQIINESNEYYLNNDIAIIHKKPTPVQIVKVDYPMRTKAFITEAYYKHHQQPITMVFIKENISILKQKKIIIKQHSL